MIKAYEIFVETENDDIKAKNQLNKGVKNYKKLKKIEVWPANIEIIQEFMKSMSQTLANFK
jgi:hypothetical protein